MFALCNVQIKGNTFRDMYVITAAISILKALRKRESANNIL